MPNARALALALTLLAAAALWPGCGSEEGASTTASSDAAASYVGRDTCAQCHVREVEAWTGSHHDLAMQAADESSVLGDFAGASFTHFDVTTTFLRRGDKYIVQTDGPDGRMTEYEVAYTFGVAPLQQYLLPLAGGRLQALSVVWDSRPSDQGGQRWFHLYPDEPIPAGDELHWTRRSQNWNFACAECHSTDLRRNFDPVAGTYATTWSEIDVSCEACHGPGSNHAAWARAGASREADGSLGLSLDLSDRSGGEWVIDPASGLAKRTRPPSPDHQLDTCGRCHSRRRQIAEGYAPDAALLDTHVPALVEGGLYHADGRIRGEVYEWGSFLQSRMHGAGVRCTDCHDPHSLRLRAGDNGLCATCHSAERFDTPEHHHHPAGGPGGRCVDCHMPETTYMGVDARRDHSFKVPRPDLSAVLGTPDVCSGCHANRDARWAAQQVETWFPESAVRARPSFVADFGAAWSGVPAATAGLLGVVADATQPALVRASALAALASDPRPALRDVLAAALADADGVVRLGALAALANYPAELRFDVAQAALEDPLLAVRIEAARLLADVDFQPSARPAFDHALAELTASEELNADTASAHHNLALIAQRRGLLPAAEEGYRRALALEADFVPAAINLSDLLREQGREDECQAVLEDAVRNAPRAAPLFLALGLALVRVGRSDDALVRLRQAYELGPEDPHCAYVYAVALYSTAGAEGALPVLVSALERHPRDRELLSAAATFQREVGDTHAALAYARRLKAVAPDDPDAAALLSELEAVRR
jgi:Tfp pilus assembly protein PilF